MAGRGRVIAARIALIWVVIVSLFMALSLPLLAPSAMSLGQWVSLAILAGYIVAAIYGIVRIEKAPREVAGVLGAAAVVALLSAINVARVFAGQGSTLGPAAVLSLLIAWSAALGIFVALIASWRGVHVHDHAI